MTFDASSTIFQPETLRRPFSRNGHRGRRLGRGHVIMMAVAAISLVITLLPSRRGLRRCSDDTAFFFGKQYTLGVCERCVERSRTGYNPKPVVDRLAKEAREAGEPAPAIQWCGCLTACLGADKHCHNCRLVEGDDDVYTADMNDEEVKFASFIDINSDADAERLFGRVMKHIKSADS